MDTERKRKRGKVLAATTAVIVASALIFTVVIDPKLKERHKRIEELHQLQLQLIKIRGDLLVKDRIDEIYSQAKGFISSEGSEQEQVSAFTRQLNGIYSKLDIKIRSVKILPTVTKTFYKRLLIKIEMKGHIRDFLSFVHSIEMHSRPIKIEQFDLKSQEIRDNIQVSLLISKVVSN